MIRLSDISLPPEHSAHQLPFEAARMLRIPNSKIRGVRIVRRSVDARKKPNVRIIYTIDVTVDGSEKKILKQGGCKRASIAPVTRYKPPKSAGTPEKRPVVVGFGPGGMFAALILALAGWKPLVLERGEDAQSRHAKVEAFFAGGSLDARSNVQFGEGGAGAFSDGKLNTGTKDVRHRWIMERLVACGAPEEILWDAKPHVGTDMLHIALQTMRRQLLALGAELRFGHRLTGITVRGGALASLEVESPAGSYHLPCRQALLALGHSARDTVEMLYEAGVAMTAKPFAVGVRIEHKQADMDAAQYKQYAGHPCLPPATYKLSCHLENGRSAFSFCVCPGGQVVAAASETGRVVTNGMSEYARDKENINGALLVNVTPEDYGGGDDPLAGIRFQRQIEAAAYTLGGGDYRAPCQRVEDFLLGRPTTAAGRVTPSYRPGVTYTDLHRCLPPFVAESIAQALPLLERRIRGYAAPDALLTAVESRSSSPVRIGRDETYQCNIRGLYPCGEGAGYAGGILSAAADGMRCAEQMIKEL